MPDVNSDAPVQPVSAAPREPQADSLGNLYKMSTTAGLGTQDYVAISGTAVTACLLGLASFLALLGPILYIVPIAALVCSIVAIRQIRNSNGTQTGIGLAVVGLLLSIGVGGYAIGSRVQYALGAREDQKTLQTMIAQLEQNVKGNQWDAAYDLFGDRFQQRVNKQTFTGSWQTIKSLPVLGAFTGMEWNGVAAFETDPTSGLRVGVSMLKFNFEQSEQPIRRQIRFRKSGDRWFIDDIEGLFPDPQQQPQGMPPGMPPMGM